MSRPQIYRISPLRRWVLWYTLGPVMLFLLICGLADPETSAAGILLAGVMLAILLPADWMIRLARLELDESGVKQVQFGYRLEAQWSEVASVDLRPGHEGLILSEPMEGRGARRLAGYSGLMIKGTSIYSPREQELLRECRYIPIAPFAWSLKHGRLQADLIRFAPHLAEALEAGPPPRNPVSPRDRLKGVLLLILILALLGLGVWLGVRG